MEFIYYSILWLVIYFLEVPYVKKTEDESLKIEVKIR